MRTPGAITKLTMVFSLSLFLTIGAAGVFAQEEHGRAQDHKTHMEKNVEVVLKGEVLDLYCFMSHPENGQGPDHAKCAQSCINKGLPIGFLSNGEVYLLLGKEHESAAKMVVDFAGIQSLMTGTIVEHHGVKAIEVSSIAKAPAK